MVVMMVMAAAGALFVMVVMMVMMVMATTSAFVIVVVMMIMVMNKNFFDVCFLVKCTHNCFFAQLIPWCRNNWCMFILFTKQMYAFFNLLIIHHLSTAHNNCRSVFYLIIIKFSKVLHIKLCFLSIYNRKLAINHNVIVRFHSFDCFCYIRKLSNTGWFDDDTVWVVFFQHFFQRLAEVTNQSTTNTSGVHFCNLYSCILQEATINSNFTKFVFN